MNKNDQCIYNKKTILFGSGSYALRFIEELSLEIAYIVDNDTKKWGLDLVGKQIFSPQQLLEEQAGTFIVFIASSFQDEISKQLEDMGLVKDKDFFDSKNLELMRHKIIFSPYFTNDEKLTVNYLDVGARGGVQIPWGLFSNLNIIGFEPDELEVEKMKITSPNTKYYPYGLWSEDVKKTYYLYEDPSTSSMYKPNPMNNHYEDRHWVNRQIKTEKEVLCKSIDTLITENTPDFIKIDTHGAEFEILKGAQNILQNNVPLVLVETWADEIHLNAPLVHDVMKLLYDNGYQLFDLVNSAMWYHKNEQNIQMRNKRKIVGFDMLFVKRLDAIETTKISNEQFIKLIGLLELYGFRDYAVYLLENVKLLSVEKRKSLIELLLKNNEEDNQVYPNLHY